MILLDNSLIVCTSLYPCAAKNNTSMYITGKTYLHIVCKTIEQYMYMYEK